MKVTAHIKRSFSRMLFWLEEHSIGILATIAIHLLLVSVFLVLKITAFTEGEYVITIDSSQIMEEKPEQPEVVQETAQEFIQQMNEEYNIRNVPVNTAEKKAVENIDQMVKDIKTEMNIVDPPEPVAEAVQEKEEKTAQIYDEKYPENALGERTIYKGPTTVSYELSDRRHTWMPVPVYKCPGRGKIVVDIVVNPRGYVIQAEVNKALSDADPCLIDAAKRDAERSRFSESSSAPAKQQGSITYSFVAQ
ncbi:MAG: hypothetical protein LBU62_04095 [Bacteroidales bacterium]|jgi:hypothetical protein|nr:hypothetical protein [Bacteroidales bacterium]